MIERLFQMLSFLFVIGLFQANGQQIGAEQNYARNAGGVVMVQAVFSATVYVNQLEIIQPRFNRLVDSVKKLDSTGKILTQEQKLDIVIKALYRNPLQYFSAGREYFRQARRVESNGTGFLITHDGFVLTNCHIIDRDSAFIRKKFILETFQEVTNRNINSLQSSWSVSLTEQQRNLLYDAYGLIYSQLSSMILFDLTKDLNVLYRIDSAGAVVSVKRKIRLVLKGKAMPGKDIAILKMDDVKNLPTLILSKDSLAGIGAEVMVLGYPGLVSSNSFLASEVNVEPSLTAGIVSAIKKTIGGWPVIQMDAVISHGSSGSPVCNDRGEVIGIATFGSLEPGSKELASGFNFAIPISVMMEFIQAANVNATATKATLLFNQGLQSYYQQYYLAAQKKFKELEKINNHYPDLQFYLQQCQQKIDQGVDKNSVSHQNVFWMMLVLTGCALIYIFFKRRKKSWR